MNEAQAQLQSLEERHRDSEARLRTVENACVTLTEIARQLKESANDREMRLRKLEEAHAQTHDVKPSSFADVAKNPAVVIVFIVCFFSLLAFAIARDPSTAQRVVDKVPTRGEVAK